MKRFLPLALALLLCASAPAVSQHPSGHWSAAVRDNILTGVESELRAGYFFADRVPKIRAAIEEHRARLVSITDPQKFADETTKVLYAATHDKHVGVDYDPIAEPVMRPNMTPADRAKMSAMMRYYGYAIRGTWHLGGNIGYFRIDGFVPEKDAYAVIDRAMDQLADTDGLIIDLRQNEGGSPRSVDYLLGYFFDKTQEVTGFVSRSHGTIVVSHKYTAAVRGKKYLGKPVYLLTSSETISGGEQFPYDLQAAKRATIVGEVTAGGANPGGDHPLTENFAVFVPVATARNPITGTNWEGVGVIPNVKTTAKAALLQAYILALKAAKNDAPFAVEGRRDVLADPAKSLARVFPTY